MLRWLLPFVLIAASGAALAQGAADRADRITAAFEAWLASVKTDGVIALRYEGAPVSVTGFGMDADAPVELASVGKSITAACVFTLVRDDLLNYQDRFDAIVGRGPNVTIAQLLVQTSGLRKDSTQKDMRGWLGDPPHRAADVLDRVIARDAPDRGPGRYAYNNENYALLGLAVEAVSGASYEETCRTRALTPAGVDAMPSPLSGAYLPWGGWAMTADDYAKWHAYWYGPDGPLGRSPLDHPHAEVVEGVWHGMGSYVRVGNGRANHWYFGALCMPGRVNVGSYAVNWSGGWSLFAAFEACLDWDDMARLDQELARAAFSKD